MRRLQGKFQAVFLFDQKVAVIILIKSLKAHSPPRRDLGRVKGLGSRGAVGVLAGSDSWRPRWRVHFCCGVRRSFFFFFFSFLFGAEARGQALLARGPLVLEDCVDVVDFAQPLEERDEVQ